MNSSPQVFRFPRLNSGESSKGQMIVGNTDGEHGWWYSFVFGTEPPASFAYARRVLRVFVAYAVIRSWVRRFAQQTVKVIWGNGYSIKTYAHANKVCGSVYPGLEFPFTAAQYDAFNRHSRCGYIRDQNYEENSYCGRGWIKDHQNALKKLGSTWPSSQWQNDKVNLAVLPAPG